MHRSLKFLALALASTTLAACGGSLGSGSGIGGGLSGPVAPNVAAGGYIAPTPLPREFTTEDKLPFVPSSGTIALPPVKGFSISIDLNAPVATPAPPGTPAAAPSGPPSAAPNAKAPLGNPRGAPPPPPLPALTPVPASGHSGVVFGPRGGPNRTLAIEDALVAALPSAAATSAADPAASADAVATSPAPAASGAAPAAGAGATAAASPLATGLVPAVAPSGTMATARPARPTHRPIATPTPSGPVVDAKTIIYPDYAPKPPDPKIKGAVSRVPLLRGYVILPSDITLGSLAAVKFVIPQNEITPGRGYTIAIFDEHKKKKPHLIVADTNVVPVQTTFIGTSDDVVELKKSTPYSFVLFADALPPSPPPAGAYPGAGNFPGQSGVGQPGPGQPGLPGQTPAPPGYPQTTAQPGYPQVPGAIPTAAYPPSGYNQPYGTPTLTATIPPNYPTFPPQ